jgi:DNA processing protein
MSFAEIRPWLEVLCTSKLPLQEITQLIKKNGSLSGALAEIERNPLPQMVRLKNRLKNPNLHYVDICLRWLSEKENRYIIPFTNEHYPPLLKEIHSPPLVLFVEGRINLLQSPQLAIVGSRNATPAALELAYHFAGQANQLGLTVTSGLARGIDGYAHRGSLEVTGDTLGVTATGLDIVYPASHRTLYEQLRQQGALVSEFIPSTHPLKDHFPRRNRIISGLSLGVLIVEASINSGSLITARFALEQGREVFAIPGSLHNPLAQGCHHLLKQGATLVETVQDIVQSLPFPQKQVQIGPLTNHEAENMADNLLTVLKCIDFTATSIEVILQRSGFTLPEVSNALLMLELNNKISPLAGGYSRLK